MSVGAGIVWSTLVVLLAIAIWRTTVNKKWRTVGKAFVWILGVCAFIGAAIWGWSVHEDRPHVVAALAGVDLGARAVDVTLALGKPSYRVMAVDEEDELATAYIYHREYDKDYSLFVGFDRRQDPRVIQICENKGSSKLFGLGNYSSEQEVIAKLGQPGATSVSHDGLRKLISYPQWKTAFGVEKGTINSVCATQDGTIEFPKEKAGDAWKNSPIVEDP